MRFSSRILFAFLALCAVALAQTNSVPLVNNPLVPTTAAPGAAGFELTVNGNGFVSASVVNWNGTSRATTFISSSQLRAAILASDLSAPGTAYVTVSSPAPGGGKSNLAIFNISLPSPSVGFNSTTTNETKNCDKTVLQPQITADFNGDGKPDVAGTVCGGGYFYVSLSNGNGTFQPAIYTSLLLSSGNIIAADFNGDGKMDIATIYGYYGSSNTVAVFLGNGDGTFQAPKTFLTGINPYYLAAADVNNDGKLDLLLPANNDNDLDVLLGNGDGTFQPYIASYTGGVGPTALVVGDFNGDGKIDAAITEQSAEVTVMFGNGDGTFSFNADYFASFGLYAAMDMNGDGLLDLVGMGTPLGGGSGGIGIMYGNPGGTFQDPVYVSVQTSTYSPGYLFGIADMNGDGKLDFWTLGNGGNAYGSGIFSILGNGNGTWQSPVFYGTTQAGYNTSGIVEGDFNNDGKPDFLVANSCTGTSCIDVILQTPVVVTPNSLAFGTKLIKGKSKPLPVTLTNAGTTAVTVSAPTFSGGNAADFSQTNNCPASLGSEASCTIQVYFVPSTEYYPESTTLSVSESAPGGTQQVALTGTGTYIRETPGSLNFGNVAVGSTSTQTVTLTNTDTQTLSVGKIYIAQSPFGKEFNVTNNCGSSLAKGASCELTVVFAPTQTGHASAKISVNFGDDIPPEVQLTGSGT